MVPSRWVTFSFDAVWAVRKKTASDNSSESMPLILTALYLMAMRCEHQVTALCVAHVFSVSHKLTFHHLLLLLREFFGVGTQSLPARTVTTSPFFFEMLATLRNYCQSIHPFRCCSQAFLHFDRLLQVHRLCHHRQWHRKLLRDQDERAVVSRRQTIAPRERFRSATRRNPPLPNPSTRRPL